MNVKDKTILGFLTGKLSPELRGKESEPPTDGEIKALLVKLTRSEMRHIVAGPNGTEFNKNSTAALQRLAKQALPAKK
jgi:hypothetical protein